MISPPDADFAYHGGVPIVDFAKWHVGSSPEEKQKIATQLVSACQSVGFVFVINHLLPPDKLGQAFAWSKKMFDLEQKQKIQVADIKESYEMGSDNYPEQPNVWLPDHVLPGFREFMTAFYWNSWENAKMILQAMAIGIGLDEDFFLRYHSGHENQLRLLHYPPVPAANIENQSMTRMSAHSDWGSITMLFQDDCGGLEIENPREKGDFIAAEPLQDAIVINVGDLLQRWSNDTLKSSLHRVTLPPCQDRFNGDEKLTRARYSIPYFVAPMEKAVIETVQQCVNDKNPAKYKPITWDEYRLMRGSMQYEKPEACTS